MGCCSSSDPPRKAHQLIEGKETDEKRERLHKRGPTHNLGSTETHGVGQVSTFKNSNQPLTTISETETYEEQLDMSTKVTITTKKKKLTFFLHFSEINS
jgi:hypothetical protein